MFPVIFITLDLPVVLMGMFIYMKYKKKLTLNTFFFVMINAVALNEFGKYQRIMSIDKELSQMYKEHSDNY
jgi:hypothetical protein